MKTITNRCTLLMFCLLFMGYASLAQKAESSNSKSLKTVEMKTFVIEREIPNAGKLTPEQLKATSQVSCAVLKEMGPKIQWVHSYVTGNKVFCIYMAENEELIREHAKKAGLPANAIHELSTVISPATAE